MILPRGVPLAVAWTALLVTGCARGRAPEPPWPVHAAGLGCPPPVTFAEGEPRPTGIRIANRSAEPVLVFMDDCISNRRVGLIGAGRTRVFRLPAALVAFDGELRFRAYGNAEGERHALARVPLERAHVLELEIPASMPSCPARVFVDGTPFDGTLLDVPAERIAQVRVTWEQRGTWLRCPVHHVETRPAPAGGVSALRAEVP